MTSPSMEKLRTKSKELKDLMGIMGMLSWDQETYLPAQAALSRARQIETFSGIYHDHATASVIGRLLDKLETEATEYPDRFSSLDLALVKEMRRDFTLASKLPKKLVRNISRQSSIGLESWKHARSQSRFSIFAPDLEKMIELKREAAECYGYRESPYDALLEEYEQGLTSAHLSHVFSRVKKELSPLVPQLQKQTSQHQTGILKAGFDQQKLWDFTMHVLTTIGFDLTRGRQDKSTHPFTMGLDPTDVRLTTRLLEENPISTILSTIHEAGHGMYEQGIDPAIADTTLGVTNSLVIHESQSRFWENIIGKSLPFWEYMFPQLQSVFPNQLGSVDAQDLYHEINVITPSPIRVDADEVTYHLHILLRTEIEQELIEGNLRVRDIPERWNSGMQELLGIEVTNDAHGCLQDIHWSQGLIGYFPTYSLGSFLAYQLHESLKQEIPAIDDNVRTGEFHVPLKWLNAHIHVHGRVFTSDELAKNITRKSIDSSSFLSHIHQKFSL